MTETETTIAGVIPAIGWAAIAVTALAGVMLSAKLALDLVGWCRDYD